MNSLNYFNIIYPELINIILDYVNYENILNIYLKDIIKWDLIITSKYNKSNVENNAYELFISYKLLNSDYNTINKYILKNNVDTDILTNKIKSDFPFMKLLPEDNYKLKLIYHGHQSLRD